MRKLTFAVLASVAGLALAAAPGAAATAASGPGTGPGMSVGAAEQADGWEPVRYAPWEVPAGARCDFAIRGEPVVNEVRKRVLATYPDGSPKREAYTGKLIMRVTNLETGAHTDADASGDAIIEYGQDGSMTWQVKGPVLVGIGENGGNLPRGTWVIDGVFTIEFSPAGYRTVRMANGTTHNVCTDID